MVNRLIPCAVMLFYASVSIGADWPGCGNVDEFPGDQWRDADPMPHGWDKQQLLAAQQLFESMDSAAVMVVHRGRLVADWGDTAQKFTAQSIRKSLVSSLIGITIDEGRLRLDATLENLGIDDSDPVLTAKERQATVRDLLLSRSGIYHSALYEVGGWARMRKALAKAKASTEDDTYDPGKYWFYNNWDFNALGTILEASAGEPIGPMFHRRIAQPIGMQDFAPGDVAYSSKDSRVEKHLGNSSDHRAYVFDVSTRDLARYGVLYLNCGDWNGRRVVPRQWVLDSIVGVDTREGRLPQYRETGFGDYGYLWQIDRENSRRYTYLDTREPYYLASGNRGHGLVIMPFLDLVIAHQVATVGGIDFDAQKRRATDGLPIIDRKAMQRLIAAILSAHPDAPDARLPD